MEQNPYAAPQVELLDTRAPERFLAGGWSAGGLRLLAWLSLALLLCDVTTIGVGVLGKLSPQLGLGSLENWLGVLDLILGCFVAWRCTRLLEDRFLARGVRWPMLILILMSVVMQACSLWFDVDFAGPNRHEDVALYLMLMYLPVGIVQVWYAIRVLKIQLPYTSVKVMGWIDLVAGVALGSVILFVAGVLLGMLSAIPMALMFFRAARELDAAAG